MHRVLLGIFAGLGMLLLSLTAPAQTVPEQIHNPYYSQEEYQNTHSMFDTIRNDLYRAQTNAYPNYLGDSPRFDIAHSELRQLEQNWDHAQYDSREIDNTISAMQMVLNDNRLMPHDRDVLNRDLSRLMEFRTEYYG